jgi:hypothetical protein
MKRLAFAMMLAILLSSSHTSWADERLPPAYRIEVQIAELKSGEESVISTPTVITLDRCQAEIQAGEQTAVEIDDDTIALETGITLRLTPYRLKEGGVKLDFEFEIAEAIVELGLDHTIQKSGIRRIQQIPLGVPVDLPVLHDGKQPTHKIRVKMTEQPRRRRAEKVPPAPRRIMQRFEEVQQRNVEEWERSWQRGNQNANFRTHGGRI